ncbi:hypothetical protein [Rhodoblastus sp.]|uniref:hypothetical protein n=1 Tax=Rhodoblastus sp. TaxID=1962975 RepID=UPI0035B0238F
MLFEHLSAALPSPVSMPRRRARAYQAIHDRRLSRLKNGSIYVIGLLTWIAILLLCDPAFLHCNRWDHQQSCAVHATHR